MTPTQRVLEAIDEIKKGHMVIMVDDEDRENEGDLVYASAFSTPVHVNFMATHARGLICVAISKSIATRLSLNPMVSSNTSSYETAFTVSVDAKNALTGISASERDETIKILANPISHADELVKPGHIFPLIAKEGGTLVRTGHTEGSVDLCRLAGLSESSVICEIIKEDGTMARRDDLDIFGEKHNLKTVFISDIVEYRLANERLVNEIGVEDVEFFGTKVKKYIFLDHDKIEHTAIVFHHVASIANVRVHNVIPDIELLLNQKKYNNLIASIEYLKQNSGILIFINKPTHNDNAAMKEFGIGAQILKSFGVSKMNLITSAKTTEFVGLSGFGLEINEVVDI
ncbi:MAG: bifunctional 3,4-dihydroxy-2-butanone 4-phosphate synthase/GTP cyclohydrolase II [Sulfurimonas sp.]|jgi:3,4-dihydroxy 2-butanone 4-phosphate synthase/GTP cyclohydrolase II|uniref:bifunctional 3,4-dihydroxy-2-butanone 4-phosphate synthase/GTP cyclohydrolase II n=1 Tax=unclassified Sulfurimonas TaxID=2623549 RepID=UPI0008CD7BF9|nr:bifunctional 3,4-dihydroxy-2-butanone 4-phosphate synthase/GTP cyclohydrolase II [Sulfurimonas sp. RIFOXYB12_FULL_35_9]MBS4069103.1 bifunctional 3,4-dihydroxy-2-butanone 4-phosphate synthase/GTP cyclohydrolase II [Sulfurimonas sp.]OHE03336.1 MAG: bifunctional 3,4-dihydroxy-2-butanone 4-phosphate synthase/GTP cyclohydrolase II [Sulfurimonas sp. RIFOXYB12_FULL_35_9]